jgi:hypothetical protein
MVTTGLPNVVFKLSFITHLIRRSRFESKIIKKIVSFTTVNSVRGDPLRKLLLIVSYQFVRKVKSQPETRIQPTLLAVGPEWRAVF